MKFRINDGNFQKSIDSIVDLPQTRVALMEHINKVLPGGLHWSSIILHSIKRDRRLGWDNVWAIRVHGQIPMGYIDSLPTDMPHQCLVTRNVEDDAPHESTDIVLATALGMTPVPEGISAYAVDTIRSGVMLSAGWEAMFEMSRPVLEEIVLVNQHTGQRILIKLEPQHFKLD